MQYLAHNPLNFSVIEPLIHEPDIIRKFNANIVDLHFCPDDDCSITVETDFHY